MKAKIGQFMSLAAAGVIAAGVGIMLGMELFEWQAAYQANDTMGMIGWGIGSVMLWMSLVAMLLIGVFLGARLVDPNDPKEGAEK